MEHVLSAAVLSFLLTTGVSAAEAVPQPVKAESASEDCSKQVRRNFSQECLRNADRAINVRLVTTNRR